MTQIQVAILAASSLIRINIAIFNFPRLNLDFPIWPPVIRGGTNNKGGRIAPNMASSTN